MVRTLSFTMDENVHIVMAYSYHLKVPRIKIKHIFLKAVSNDKIHKDRQRDRQTQAILDFYHQ